MSVVTHRLLDWWHQLPTWGKWTIGILSIFSIDALRMAWGDGRPAGAFFESLVAVTLYWGMILGTFAGAIWVGLQVSKRSSLRFLGWIAGIAFFLVFGTATLLLTRKIAGVGWRIQALMESDHEREYGRR
jgi:hypothetical protein